jgi:hypothetical protein
VLVLEEVWRSEVPSGARFSSKQPAAKERRLQLAIKERKLCMGTRAGRTSWDLLTDVRLSVHGQACGLALPPLFGYALLP